MNANSRPMEDSLKKTDTESDEPPIGSGQAEAVPAPQQNTKDGEGRILGWVKNLLPVRQHNSDDTLRDAIEELIEGIVADVEAYADELTSGDDTCLIGVRRSES